MVSNITSFVRNAAIDQMLNRGSSTAGSSTAGTSTQTPATSTTTPATPNKTNSRSESAQYTAVQQSLSNGKTAITAASKANNDIDAQLKNVKDIANKLADSNVTGTAREKLQADYTKARDSIIAAQEKATVKNGDNKTNLLTDSKNQTVSTNTRGGTTEVKAANNAKALGLPEKINSASDAQALLSGDPTQAGSLAKAQQQTQDNSKALKQADEDISKRLKTATNVAKSVQGLENARSGNQELSADKAQQRERALALARDASEQVKNQLSGLTGNNRSNSLASLFG